MSSDLPLPSLPARPATGHKGTFGTVAVVGGSCAGESRIIGAPTLSAVAALRAGCGLVRLAMPGPILAAGIVLAPSATGTRLPTNRRGEIIAHEASAVIDRLVTRATCMVIGPGLGEGEGPSAASLRAVQQESIPVVVDADALNCLAQVPQLHKDFHARAILTPHPGEFSRLAQALKVSQNPTNPAQRAAAAQAMAQGLGCVVVLKGAGTVVSDGIRTWTCTHGHPSLATAGTGDVLAGLIAGLVAQFATDEDSAMSLFDAARIGVQAHAIAGEEWARKHTAQAGLLARELADELPAVLEGMRA
jgi:NAD(P)H-hydrate epimerase